MSGAPQQHPLQLLSSRVMICTRTDSSMASHCSADDSPKFLEQQLGKDPGSSGQHLHSQQQQEKLHTCTTGSELASPVSYANSNWSIASFAPGQEQNSARSAAAQTRGSGGNAEGRISPFAAALQQVDNNQTGQCIYRNAETVDSMAGWAQQNQQHPPEHTKSPVRQAARKHAAVAIRQFADDLDAAGLPNFQIRELAGQYSSALDHPDTPKHIGVVSGQRNSSRQVGNSCILTQQQSSHYRATGSTTEPQTRPADASGSGSSNVPEALAALLAIVKDEWEWANMPGGGARVPDSTSDAAAQPLLPDSPGAILEVKEGAAAIRDHGKYTCPRRSDGDSSPAGQLRARYGRDSSRAVSPARSTVQYSSTPGSSRTSPTRGSILHTTSSSSTSNTSRTATTYTCGSSSSSSYGSPTRTHPAATSYTRYGSPPRNTGQLNRSSSVNVRRSISPGKTAAGFGSSSSTSRTVSPSRNAAAYSARRTGSPSRSTPAGSTSSCRRSSSSPRRNLSPTRGAGATAHPQAAALSCAAAAVASGGSRNTNGQRLMQQTHSAVLPRVAESCASAYECVVPEVISGIGGVSMGGNRARGSRANEGGGRSSSGKSWRGSEVQQISLGGYAHAHAASIQTAQAASQLIFVPEHQVEASVTDFSCQSNLDRQGEVQHQVACRISNRSINDSVEFEASLSGTHAAAAVPAHTDQLPLDRCNIEQQKLQQAAIDAAAMFDFKLPPPIRTRSNPSDMLAAAAPPVTSSCSAAGREPAALPRISASSAAATAAATSNSRRQTAQQQQQPMSRSGSFNSTLSTCSNTKNTANGSSNSSSISAGGFGSCNKTADTCQHANIGEQEHQESDSETSMLNPLFSNSNTPKNLSRSGSVPGTGSTGHGAEAVPCCTVKSCSTGSTDQTELRHRLSQSTAAAAAESALMGKQEAPASSPEPAVSWSHESNGGVQGKELTSVAAYLAGGNTRVFDTAFSKGPNTASFKTPAARSSPKQQDASATWVQRLTGSRTARDSSGSQNSHQSHASNVSNNTVRTSGCSSTSSKSSVGSGNGSPVGSSVGSRSSCANSPLRVSVIGSASQGFAAGLKDRAGRSTGGGAKYKRRLLFVLPLLMLLAALGVGAWAWAYVVTAEKGTHAAAAAGAAAGGPALTFRVVVAVPSVAANKGCGRWFDGSQRVRDYQELVSAAYSKALNLPLPENPVLSITCGGSVVFHVSPPTAASEDTSLLQSIGAAAAVTQVASASAAPATQSLAQTGMYASRLRNRDVAAGRMLLQQFFKAYPATIDVETVFAVPDKFSDANQRADFVERVLSTSAATLAQPLQQFLSVPAVMVKAVELLTAQVNYLLPVAAASRTAAANLSDVTSESRISSTVSAASMAPPATSSKPYSNSSITWLTPEHGQANQDWSGAQGPVVRWENVNGTHQFADYQSAVTCTFPPTKSNSAADLQGRLWSWLNGVECAFRAPAAGQPAASTKPRKFEWETAVLCDDVPNEHNSVIDDSGRLWGWQNGVSCAFRLYGKGSKPAKPDTVGQKAPAASFKDMQEHLPSRVSTVWESAQTCTFAPNDSNTVPDTFGRLWGWENNGSCAFRWESLPN